MIVRTMVILFLLGEMMLAADDEKDRVLFSFEEKNAGQQWQAVNDGVMGGRSDGRVKITDNKTMEFIGTLSLENNGGFASVRTRPTTLGLKKSDTLVARVRGDGLGILLGDKKAGSFKLEMEWIKVRTTRQPAALQQPKVR